jgi:hypothetical protein
VESEKQKAESSGEYVAESRKWKVEPLIYPDPYLSTGGWIYIRTDGWTDGKKDKQMGKGTDNQMDGLRER